jgi:hypothetical protein
MLKFVDFIAEEKKAHAFIATLLEEAEGKAEFVLTEDQQTRMKEILQMFPNILKRKRPEHVTYLPSKAKPDLESYDRNRRE